MINHTTITNKELYYQIKQKAITFGGNKNLKIYGKLQCKSGMRLQQQNRVFFVNEQDAINNGYRPCGHCLPQKYKKYTMELFDIDTSINLLPIDGIVNYYGMVLPPQEATNYLDILLSTIEWKNDEVTIFGKHIITKRKVAWYGDTNFTYTYSNTTKQAYTWTKELLVLKAMVEAKTQTKFNSVLLNLYHNGNEGMGWHSDDEKSISKDSTIASLSLGAERRFLLKHRTTKQNVAVQLHSGSLLTMKGSTQSNWLHSLPKTTKVTTPRINLTFRTMV